MPPRKAKQSAENEIDSLKSEFVEAIRQLSSTFTAPDLVSTLKEFDGNQLMGEAKEWLNNIESMAEIHNWAKKVQLEAARRKLTGGARSWFLMNKESLTTWESFRKSFKDNFVSKLTLVDKWQRFNACVQKDSESVSDYIFEKLQFAKAVGVDESEAKTMVCAGLEASELAHYLRSDDYEDASDYMQRVCEHKQFNKEKANLESLNRQSKDRFIPKSKTHSKENTGSEKGEPGKLNTGSFQGRCFNCGEFANHVSCLLATPQASQSSALPVHSCKECTATPSNQSKLSKAEKQ